MTVDVIIVSDAKNSSLRRTTENALRSLHHSDDTIKFNAIVIEANKEVSYKKATTVYYDFDFNYNKCLNLGASKCNNDVILFCNNDLIFSQGFMRGLLMANKMGYESFCPISPGCEWHKDYRVNNCIVDGYEIGKQIPGWCIGMTRKTYKKIGGFNEDVMFWYSDNIYGEQIKAKGIKNCLVCNSIVFHLGNKTLNSITRKLSAEYTSGQEGIFNKAKLKYDT